jgi:outer membrane biosynthesis protein TonB
MKLKKVLLITVPLVLLIGTGAGLVFMGVIKVPFLAKKKTEKPAVAKKADKPKPKETPKPPPAKKPAPQVTVKAKPVPTSDPDKGVKKVASLWNEMEVEKLQALTADWSEPDLAKVLAKMDVSKVAELLAVLPPTRASALTRAIQTEAARLPIAKA